MPNFDGNLISLSSRLEKKIPELIKTQAVVIWKITMKVWLPLWYTHCGIHAVDPIDSHLSLPYNGSQD